MELKPYIDYHHTVKKLHGFTPVIAVTHAFWDTGIDAHTYKQWCQEYCGKAFLTHASITMFESEADAMNFFLAWNGVRDES